MDKIEQALGFELKYFKYAILGLLLNIGLLALGAFFIDRKMIPDKYILVTIICIFIGTFLVSFLTGKNSSKKRLFSGILVSLIIFLMIFILALISGPVNFSLLSIGSILFSIISAGILGGFLSTYTKKPKKSKK